MAGKQVHNLIKLRPSATHKSTAAARVSFSFLLSEHKSAQVEKNKVEKQRSLVVQTPAPGMNAGVRVCHDGGSGHRSRSWRAIGVRPAAGGVRGR